MAKEWWELNKTASDRTVRPVVRLGDYKVNRALKHLDFLTDDEKLAVKRILLRRSENHSHRLVEYDVHGAYYSWRVRSLLLVAERREVIAMRTVGFPILSLADARSELASWLASFPFRAAVSVLLAIIADFLGWSRFSVQMMTAMVLFGSFFGPLPGTEKDEVIRQIRRFEVLVKRGQLALGPFIVLAIAAVIEKGAAPALDGSRAFSTGIALYFSGVYGLRILDALRSWGVPIPPNLISKLRDLTKRK